MVTPNRGANVSKGHLKEGDRCGALTSGRCFSPTRGRQPERGIGGELEGKVDMTAEVPLGIIQNTGIRTERSILSGVGSQEGSCFVLWGVKKVGLLLRISHTHAGVGK